MNVTIINLGGPWAVQRDGKGKRFPASVPGDIYRDLLTAGEIPDPFYRDNERDLQWIGESRWSYTRRFSVSKALLAKSYILLRCKGLDTFARISINGRHLAETNNMFRTYEWDVKKLLKPGRNAIQIDFDSVLPYLKSQQDKHPGWEPMPFLAAYPGWVRKEHCNFGWDWGIKAVTCGIWRDIELVAYDAARISEVAIAQAHGAEGRRRMTEDGGPRSEVGGWETREDGTVGLKVDVRLDRVSRGALQGKILVSLGGKVVASEEAIFRGKQATVSLIVDDARLWWPNGMGEQPLYEVKVELLDKSGKVMDIQAKRIGLRTLELDRHHDPWGESFQFKVNGIPFFAKGANWIPVDAILARRTPDDYRRLVGNAAACNMTMLRVWGGGIYEDDAFYDACDELGICVWQDFMFACSAYPTFEKGFIANVRQEARDNIRRLRHHPCMALWCGNNELEMMNVSDDGWQHGKIPWKAYKRLFDELLPRQVSELSPDISYWPSSPHSSRGDRSKHRSPDSGDAHLWIMGARYPLTCAQGMEHRFASEFGFQSFPVPETINSFTEPDDRNIASRIMEHHQRAPQGNTDIVNKMLQCFRMPTSFDNMLWLSQILQGESVKNICEHFRRNMPRTMGALYWQLNDCWPVASWSSIDYHGRWKALQYMAARFFEPILISGFVNEQNNTIDIHLTSDRRESVPASVTWTLTDAAGNIITGGHLKTKTPANGSSCIKSLPLDSLLKNHPRYDALVWLQADIGNDTTRHNLVFLAPPKHLKLSPDPQIRSRISQNKDESFTVTLNTQRIALWVWLDLKDIEAEISSNFFHMRPAIHTELSIRPKRKTSTSQLAASLRICSLVDTYH